ncbi:MAG: DUF2851 family protein [Chthoniobacteraceae bacterium]
MPAALREEPLLHPSREFTELELQAHWFAGDFGREFTTIGGDAVRVVQFGVWNREAGPDFAEAAISLNGGDPQRGCIELDPDVRDWERHGHATNPAYDAVVLHVFTQTGSGENFTRTARNRNVPQVRLDLARLDGAVVNPQPAAKEGHCAGPLRGLAEEKVREVLLGAAQFRLRRKSAALARLGELHGQDEALYQALAATLGYRNNKLPFTLLAQRLPLKLLRRHDADALLFGVSGFLPATDLGAFDSPTRGYLRGLWEKWWPQRGELERLTLAPEVWNFAGQRPANHPQRRLAALARIVAFWPKVRALAKRGEPGAIREFFAGLTDDYWDFHYTVSSKSAAKRMALVGDARVTDMLANVFFPLALITSEASWIGFKNLAAPLTNRRVEVAALRLFGSGEMGRSLLRSAAMQQGLLQIYEDFCMRDASDCDRCLFPRQLARW